MKVDDAACLLAEAYRSAPRGERVPYMHLFGIRYAQELDGMALTDLAALAGIPESLATEIRKGIKLAPYVALRPENDPIRLLEQKLSRKALDELSAEAQRLRLGY